MSNYNLIKDGDILISDMYLSSEQIMRILKSVGFNKNVNLFSSSCGKSKYDGTMYKYLKTLYNISIHKGDNEHSDIKMASIHGIKNKLTTLHKLTSEEQFFMNIGSDKFALIIREFRHQNQYEENSREFSLYNNQVRFNIPFLVIFSHELNQILLKENRDTLLFTTRDCCLLKHIFTTIYPQYKTIEFQASRRMFLNYNEEYKEYLRSVYDDKKCIIVDMNGSFYSGRQLFMEVFGKLPRVHVAVYNNLFNAPTFEGFSFTIKNNRFGREIELFNSDIQGTLVDIKDGKFIRDQLEFNMDDALIYKECVLKFCEFIRDKHILEFKNINKLLDFFTLNYCFNPHIKIEIIETLKGLEKIFLGSIQTKPKTLRLSGGKFKFI